MRRAFRTPYPILAWSYASAKRNHGGMCDHFTTPLSRRRLLASASGLLLPGLLRSADLPRSPLLKIAGAPNFVTAATESGVLPLHQNGAKWQGGGIEVTLAEGSSVTLSSPSQAVMRVHLRWEINSAAGLQFLGDAWERSYGELAWRGMDSERIMPWYFLAFDGASTVGIGVKTGPSALCFWQVDPAGVSLWLDVRNGGRGVKLGTRQLTAASIVTEFYSHTRPFQAAKLFCKRMCGNPRMPAAPVYGGNNWYYAYGKSSAADIRDDSERIAALASSSVNRPFMVIDDGWTTNADAGPWSYGNDHFPDMPELASKMRGIGVQPGIWMRPLFTKEKAAAGWQLQSPNAAREYAQRQIYTLDPTIPEALQKIKQDVATLVAWQYSLVKHDFSSYDLLGRWGFRMDAEVTDANWNFADRTRTNAEIIGDLYAALREAAGNAMLLGCNTIGHLSAGLFELQRIGDDTSGREWNRTRRMGVNTLAFRAPQHGTFFAVDADCVGITKQVAWDFNRQWLDLLARSGTPLFVSAAPDALGTDQRAAVKEAFTLAAKNQELGEPLDWLQNTEPRKWKLGGQPMTYDWFGPEGVTSLTF